MKKKAAVAISPYLPEFPIHADVVGQVRTLSTVLPPAPFAIETDGDVARVSLYANVQAHEEGHYSYNTYYVTMRNRPGLEKVVAARHPEWLQLARDAEYNALATNVRAKRDELIAASDWTQMNDVPLSADKQEAWQAYRQQLRDVPLQSGFPYAVDWPKLVY